MNWIQHFGSGIHASALKQPNPRLLGALLLSEGPEAESRVVPPQSDGISYKELPLHYSNRR
jgi:hypothetical protein